MKRAIVLGLSVTLALAILALGAMPAQAGGKKVVYTFSVASLGEPVAGFPSGGGGPLFADGTAGGQFGVSIGNGEIIQIGKVTSWAPVGVLPDGTVVIGVCIEVHTIKGDVPDFSFCGEGVVTGTPVFIDFNGDGSPDAILRITPAN